jgi:broad specificity phosphatase PhoE
MKLYLFRHAEKASHFHPNPGLSAAGSQQALKLLEKVQNSEMPRPTQLWASPKKRAQESLQPLANHLELPLKAIEALDERVQDEDRSAFCSRIQKFLNTLEKEEGVIYICTHSDWIEEALTLISSEQDLANAHPHWHPLQYLALQKRGSLYDVLDYKRIPV